MVDVLSIPGAQTLTYSPPTRGSTRAPGTNHFTICSGSVRARKTSSGVAFRSMMVSWDLLIFSLQICGFAGGFFQLDGGINGGEQAETPPSLGLLVMIFRRELRNGGGHLFGEGGAGFSASEADFGFHGQSGNAFSGLAGADAERGQLANHARGSRSEISGGEAIGRDAIAGLGSDQEFAGHGANH